MTKILFISRAYPPIVGGIENQNWELANWLAKISEVKIIANRRGKNFLPFFLPYALIRALWLFRKYDTVLLGDAVLGIIGWKLKLFYRKPVICVAHGLDLTYKNWFYQTFWIKIFLKKIDKIIAVGNETARIAKGKGMPPEKIAFIPNGVDPEKCFKNYKREELEKIVGENLSDRKILLTSGRLAKRKGVAWFCENVLPELSQNITYVVAGDGEDRKNIKNIIEKNNLSRRVKLLGYVTDRTKNVLFNTCDLFIQPNIQLRGTIEGFGISVIEAASCQLPVIASNLEGLRDAIKDGQNGFLVEPENAEAWTNKINELLSNNAYRKEFGEKARQYVIENYSWDKISRRYLEEIEKTINQ